MPPRSKQNPRRRRQSTVKSFFTPVPRLSSPQPSPQPSPPYSPPPPTFSTPSIPDEDPELLQHDNRNPAPAESTVSSPLTDFDPPPAPPPHFDQVTFSSVDLPPFPRNLCISAPFEPLALPQTSTGHFQSPVTLTPSREHCTKPPFPCVGLTEQPSRLSRSRNLARKAKERGVEPAKDSVIETRGNGIAEREEAATGENISVHHVIVKRRQTAERAVELIECNEGAVQKIEKLEEEGEVRFVVDMRVEKESEEGLVTKQSKKRAVSPKRGEKELHPFFKVTAAAVMRDRERQKRPKITRPVVDAWTYIGATVHVNRVRNSCLWEPGPSLGGADVQVGGTRGAKFLYYSENQQGFDEFTRRREVVTVSDVRQDLWAEKYKLDKRVDAISASATTELIEWLSYWYSESRGRPIQVEEYSDDESDDSFYGQHLEMEKDTIAIITGPVGCGKSTIVANAARHFGLTILEINASSCRTGKRVRDIVREAMRTHRVTTSKIRMPMEGLRAREKSSSEAANARTLILFEEVDELQDDERGFWACIQELAASRECRRPIICTANKFSHLMRQLFLQEKDPVEADLDRLLIQTKVEQIINPLSYKHITMPSRTERQALAVLNEVVAAENIDMSSDSVSYLATNSQRDSRKAINLLHFWGMKGLTPTRSGRALHEYDFAPGAFRYPPGYCAQNSDFCILESISSEDVCPAMFQVGTENFIAALPNPELPKVSEALGTWIESLELLSFSDDVLRTTQDETTKRCLRVDEDFPDLCFDNDLKFLSDTTCLLNREAVSFSRPYLQFADHFLSVAEIGKQCSTKLALQPPGDCPKPRRPMASDYMPILRTMATKEGTAIVNGKRMRKVSADCKIPRTRASTKRGGFCALDLNPCTISELKRNNLTKGK